jgi:GntR family transcriptional regulator/MocR family aminotransferase
MKDRGELFIPLIDLDRVLPVPLHHQVHQQIASAIASGAIPRNARLPATRVLAKLLRVSRNTVLLAYEDLAADNLIRGRHGSGMWVNSVAPKKLTWFGLRQVIRAAGYPAKVLTLADPDGNSLYIRF